MKRRIAATAATAALALSGPATAVARPASRAPQPTRPAADPVARLVHSEQSRAAASLDLSRRSEKADHRQRLAGALAAELGDRDPSAIERALEAADAEIDDAYARGERPAFIAGIPAALVASTGISDDELTAAFESMSRNALERRRAASG